MAQSVPDWRHADRDWIADVARGACCVLQEDHRRYHAGGFGGDRHGAGARNRAGDIAERRHHGGRAVSGYRSHRGRPVLVPAFNPCDCRRGRERAASFDEAGGRSSRHADAVHSGDRDQWSDRLRRHRILPEILAAAHLALLHLLPSDFWHNSNRSGSLPPASGMKLLSPTQHKWLNEVTGFLLLSVGVSMWLSLVSYQAQDPSWNTSAGLARPLNL